MDSGEFLKIVFAGIDRGWVAFWRSDTRRTVWVEWSRLDHATVLARECEASLDCHLYYGVGVQRRSLSAAKRGEAAGVVAIPGAWIDLDLAEGAGLKGSKKRYPPREDADRVLAGLPLAPSLVVHTGGGLHCYWLFNELLSIASLGAREAAARLVKGWESLVDRKLCEAGGWDIDHVHDLARVLRPVGSWNPRSGVHVELIRGDNGCPRYYPEDLEQFIVEADDLPALIPPEILMLDGGANPVVDKLEALRVNSPEFTRVWERKKDYPSESERDLALANHCVRAMWTDQEIADLLIANSRSHDPGRLRKLLKRPKYLQDTIAMAREGVNRDQALSSLSGAGQHGVEDKRPATISMISDALGVAVSKWIQFGRESPVYTLVLADGRELRVGGAAAMTAGDGAMRSAIYSSTGRMIQKIRGKAWNGLCEALASIAEVIDPPDASTAETLRSAILAYLEAKDVYDAKQRNLACASGEAFISEEKLHINLGKLRRWLAQQGIDRWDRVGLLDTLRGLGFTDVHVNYTKGDRRTSARYWQSPNGFVPN